MPRVAGRGAAHLHESEVLVNYLQFLDYISAPGLGWVLLLIATIIDFVLPFFLGLFVKRFSHAYMPMSALGEAGSPVRSVYSRWLVFAGLLFLFAAPQVGCAYTAADGALAMAAAVCIAAYGAGACILAGIFAAGEGARPQTVSEWIHGGASAVGFIALIAAALLLSILQFLQQQVGLAVLSLVCFAAAAAFFVLFILADKDRFIGTAVARCGLWQRLAMLAMYVPLIATAAAHLQSSAAA